MTSDNTINTNKINYNTHSNIETIQRVMSTQLIIVKICERLPEWTPDGQMTQYQDHVATCPSSISSTSNHKKC